MRPFRPIVAAIALGLVLTPPMQATAAVVPDMQGSFDRTSVQVDGRKRISASDRSEALGAVFRRESVSGSSVVRYVYTFVASCDGNSPDPGLSAGTLCSAAVQGCPPGQIRHWVYRSPESAQPRVWARNGTRCMVSGAAVPGVAGTEVAVVVTVEDLRRLPLPPARASVEPSGGSVLVGVPVNVYATTEEVVIPTEVLGQAVQVRARAVGYSWTFGDGGGTGAVSDPGAPYPQMVHTHTYTRPGDYEIALATAYEGEFSVGGGPWLPIEGQAVVDSTPQTTTVVSATNDLVDTTT